MFPTDLNQSEDYKNLINFCLDIPIAFAIWENQSDVILISYKMQSLIRSDSVIINSINFIKSIKPIFGNFLYDAVGKISGTQFSNGKYSNIFKTPYNKIYSLILHYNLKSQIYIFTALDITNNAHLIDNNSNNLQNEIKILNEILDKIPLYIWRRTKDSKISYSNKYFNNNLSNKINDLSIFKNINTNNDTNISLKIKGEDRNLNINEYYSIYNNTKGELDNNISIIGIANDTTELHNIKNELEKYKKDTENINTIINNINCGIALFSNNMNLLCINDYTKQLFNLQEKEIINKSYSEIIDYVVSNELIVSNLSNTILKNKLMEIFQIVKDKPLEKQLSINNRDNININIIPDSKGNILFVFHDNSYSIDMARNNNSVKQMYNTVINNINEGIIIFGTDNKIKIYNEIIKNIFNINKENINNLNIKDFFALFKNLFNNNYLENFTNNLFNNIAKRTSYSEVINLLNNKTIDYTYVPLNDGLNLIKMKDISNYKLMEDSLKNAYIKVNKTLELKNTLISTLADEYFSPLDAISSFAEILNNKYFGELNEKQQEYCLGIIKTSNRLKDIAEMINYITRIQLQLENEISNKTSDIIPTLTHTNNTEQLKLVLTEVNISSFVKTTVEQFNSLEQNVKIITTCNNNALKAYIDKNILNRILYYSVSQALYMIDDSGIIQIESSICEEDNKYFSLIISDNGYGLSQDDVLIYNKYLSNNINIGEIKTMDLRYAVLHYLVCFHKGKISLESKEGEGSKIKIILQINI